MNALPTFKRYPLLLEFLVVGIFAAVANYFASSLGLYYAVWYADVIMHFVGGLWIGLAALLVFFTSGAVRRARRGPASVALTVLTAVLAVGVAWEIYELALGLTDLVLDAADTVSDIAMDLVGGSAALVYFWAMVAPHPENHDARA